MGVIIRNTSGQIVTSTVAKTNLSAATAPTSTDDVNSGFGVGSFWIDTATDKVYFCTDATVGSAVWVDVTASGGGSSGLTTTTLSGATILNTTYDVVLCGGGTSYTVTLPAALSNPDKSYYIKNINPNGDDINIYG